MPNKESEGLSVEDKPEAHAELVTLQECLKSADLADAYTTASDLLRQTNDAYRGIVSHFDSVSNTWYRDSRGVYPLNSPERPDEAKVEGNNALMRVLSRLRPIDYVLEKKLGDQAAPLRENLKTRFLALSQKIIQIKEDPHLSQEDKLNKIQELETSFNNFLIQTLHEADLTQGCYSQEDAEALLFHYRNLSSLLYPARTMVTLTYDKEAKVLHRETQYPVTKKGFANEAEREAEKTHLKSLQAHPSSEKKTAHNSKALAFQEADAFFAEYLVDETRALGAQARKTHVDGPYNAFVVELKVAFLEAPLAEDASLEDAKAVLDQAPETASVWLARSGSPAYLGKGESKESIAKHTQRNLEAIRETAKEKRHLDNQRLNVTILNTNSRQEKQHVIVNNVISAVEKGQEEGKGDGYRYIPLNPEGTLHGPHSNLPGFESQSGRGFLHRATRLLDAVSSILATFLSGNPEVLEEVQCASGQDRTGTLVEKTFQEWLKAIYAKYGRDSSFISKLRAMAGNAAEITTHHVQGSPGMKPESRANDFFGGAKTFEPEEEKALYLKSSSTNKKNKLSDVECLTKPSLRAIAEFEKAYATFLEKKQSLANNELLTSSLEELDKQVLALRGEGDINQLKPETLDELREVLTWINKTLNEKNLDLLPNHLEALSSLAEEISGKRDPAWQNLGKALLGFAFVSLMVIGVLAAVPTGGASLLVTLLAANLGTGLMGTMIAGAGIATASLGMGAIGASLVWQKAEKGLAKSVSEFKNALKALHPEVALPDKIVNKEESKDEDGKGQKLN